MSEKITFKDYESSVSDLLNIINAGSVFAGEQRIIIKPNLITDKPFPVTTPPDIIKALISYIQRTSSAEIIIAEGNGHPSKSTWEMFSILGYNELARKNQVKLIDLNEETLEKLEKPHLSVFKEFYVPKVLSEGYLISVPVLKAHSFSTVTLSLKNMLGIAPPKYYGNGGSWKKSIFHREMEQSIIEVNHYVKPDMALLDATVGLPSYHLGGKTCDPPVNKLVAGYDAVEVDREGASLLGFDPDNIPHLLNSAYS